MAAVRPANVVRERGACTPAQRRHARDGFDPEYAGADDEHHPQHDPPCRTASWRWDGATITALLPCRQPFNLGAPPPVRSAAVGGVENTALTIADLGKATNTKVKTTGYYPRIGPLPKPIRCAGNYRTNGVDEMGCRSFIRRIRDLGFRSIRCSRWWTRRMIERATVLVSARSPMNVCNTWIASPLICPHSGAN